MPKRFTDTEKWKDDWYLSLTNDQRIIWQYLLDNCSIAGIIKISFKHLNFCCNCNINDDDIKTIFNGRLMKANDYYFIPKFLLFQYPKGLGSNKPAIIGVKNELNKYNLIDAKNNIIFNHKVIITNCYTMIKDKDTDKDKVKDKEEEKAEIIIPDDTIKLIYRTVYLHEPGIVEMDFVKKLISKFGEEKAKYILYDFKKKGFHVINTMETALNEDGSIKSKTEQEPETKTIRLIK
jgi:hypothetical protein